MTELCKWQDPDRFYGDKIFSLDPDDLYFMRR